MNVLSMLYKKYGAPVEEPDIAEPLVEWARVTSDVPIPTLKRYHHISPHIHSRRLTKLKHA